MNFIVICLHLKLNIEVVFYAGLHVIHEPYRFPNNTLFFERWVEEQAELDHPFYCGGFPQLDNALCRIR